ncbi:MAG: hypothetical protein LBP37_01785 [Spirochaetaceae bacterium]|nr:hypothetical protein [Spirochaetaceae bacterium]
MFTTVCAAGRVTHRDGVPVNFTAAAVIPDAVALNHGAVAVNFTVVVINFGAAVLRR